MKNLFRLFVLTTLLGTAVWGVSAQNAVKISIQGTLKDVNGTSVEDGQYDATFRLYESVSGGTHIWEEIATVQVVGGVYGHRMGGITPFEPTKFDTTLFVGVTLNGVELSPRTELTYAPYTLHTQFASRTGNGVPAGTLVPFSGPIANRPFGYIACDGRALKSADFPELFAALGTAWGDGSDGSGASPGVTDFNVPDSRGAFLRGWGEGINSADPDRNARTENRPGGATGNNVGTYQADAGKAHAHLFSASGNTSSAGDHSHDIPADAGSDADLAGYLRTDQGPQAILLQTNPAGDHTHTITISGTTGNSGSGDTRSKNVAVLYLIKY